MKKTHLEASFILSGYLCKDLNVKNLELFVYKNDEMLESIIGNEEYLNIIQIDYQGENPYYDFNIEIIKACGIKKYYYQVVYLIAKYHLKLISLTEILILLDDLSDELNGNLNYDYDGNKVNVYKLPIDLAGYSSEVSTHGEEFYRDNANKEIYKLLDAVDKDRSLYDYYISQLGLYNEKSDKY